MAVVYVASSKGLGKWAADVGLTQHVYKIGVADEGDDAAAAVKALNEAAHAGETDWRLVARESTDAVEADSLLERLGRKERMVDPLLYPKIKGARGIFKIKPANVENHLMVKRALAGETDIVVKLKPADIGAYLIQNALGDSVLG
jgi:hypothetical protein